MAIVANSRDVRDTTCTILVNPYKPSEQDAISACPGSYTLDGDGRTGPWCVLFPPAPLPSSPSHAPSLDFQYCVASLVSNPSREPVKGALAHVSHVHGVRLPRQLHAHGEPFAIGTNCHWHELERAHDPELAVRAPTPCAQQPT